MRTKVKFDRKENEIYVREVQIDKIIELPGEEFDSFSHNMLRNYDFITEFSRNMYIDNDGIAHGMLVLGEGNPDGVIVNSEGSGYAQYSSFLPNAKVFVYSEIKKISDEIIRKGLANTKKGAWTEYYDEIFDRYDIHLEKGNGIVERLEKELSSRSEVKECVAFKDGFEMLLNAEHCPHVDKKSIHHMTLSDLMNCNLEDVHLLDSTEEHDLATIVELNANTLTPEGKRDWADVLNSKVERIYSDYYGLQVDVSGCSPERLRDFSYMLAGQCSAEDYNRWVSSGQDQSIKM